MVLCWFGRIEKWGEYCSGTGGQGSKRAFVFVVAGREVGGEGGEARERERAVLEGTLPRAPPTRTERREQRKGEIPKFVFPCPINHTVHRKGKKMERKKSGVVILKFFCLERRFFFRRRLVPSFLLHCIIL